MNILYLYRHICVLIDIAKTSISGRLFTQDNCNFHYNFQNNDRDLEYYYNNIRNYRVNYCIFDDFVTDDCPALSNKIDKIKLLL